MKRERHSNGNRTVCGCLQKLGDAEVKLSMTKEDIAATVEEFFEEDAERDVDSFTIYKRVNKVKISRTVQVEGLDCAN